MPGPPIRNSPCQTAHLVPATHLRPGFATSLHPPRIEGVGGAPRNVRVRARHPWGVSCASQTRVNALMTRYARRLRGALRPMTLADSLSAVQPGGLPAGAAL